MLLKGDGEEAEHIAYGSTLSLDGNPSRQFDFMLSNPPYGKSWKTDADKLGGKNEILDTRFNTYLPGGDLLKMIPRASDGQLLFLLNNVSKMKTDTELGSRIIEVHNGSSLFTGDAGSGEQRPPLSDRKRPGGSHHCPAGQHVLQHGYWHLHLGPVQ